MNKNTGTMIMNKDTGTMIMNVKSESGFIVRLVETGLGR